MTSEPTVATPALNANLPAALRADLIDGKALAAVAIADIKAGIKRLKRAPCLAILHVGADDPKCEPSRIYVRNKLLAADNAGIKVALIECPSSITQAMLLARISQLNIDPAVDGILVQLPLPNHIDRTAVMSCLSPVKDVDGLTPTSQGRMMAGLPGFVPCTPKGVLRLIDSVTSDLEGAEAVVIGRSQLVGQPLAQLLLQRGCTVTIAHQATRDLASIVRRADIVCSAAGAPNLVRGHMLKPGALVIDVGITRLEDGSLTGDVNFDEAVEVAGAITPVPGGVGPMTIACLLENTLTAALNAPPQPVRVSKAVGADADEA